MLELRRCALVAAAVLVMVAAVSAHQAEEFTEAENIVRAGVPCSQMTVDQMAQVGEYYSEHMTPETRERFMDRHRVEDSLNSRQAHVEIAEEFYCGDSRAYYHHPHHYYYGNNHWGWPRGGLIDFLRNLF